MSKTTEAVTLSTQAALDAIAYGRGATYPGRSINRRIVCSDDFRVSIQASNMHYAHDSHPSGEAPYWSLDEREPAWPFVTFELGNPSGEIDGLDEYENGGIWAWVPRVEVESLLKSHGGAVEWEVPA